MVGRKRRDESLDRFKICRDDKSLSFRIYFPFLWAIFTIMLVIGSFLSFFHPLIRFSLVFPGLLLMPGYGIMAFLLADKKPGALWERLIIYIVLSLAIVVVVSVAFLNIGIGITTFSIAAFFVMLNAGMLVLLHLKFPEKTFVVSLGASLSLKKNPAITYGIILWVALLLLISASVMVDWKGESFTLVSILSNDAIASNEIQINESMEFAVTVLCMEQEISNYRVNATIIRSGAIVFAWDEASFTLEHSRERILNYNVLLQEPGEYVFAVNVFINDDALNDGASPTHSLSRTIRAVGG
ncbi:MAG: DUF1616 domain-containing protein [Candidatus Thermoplasmatota archaeon]|nr:DUF1616 domain-containing protein [Candidatus Thermoplasmatota archaeon]